MAGSSSRHLVVHSEDQTPHKWRVSLSDEVFKAFLSQGSPVVNKIFGEGSLFSPLLFGKFFDPSDAFPLWEFESDILLANLRTAGKTSVDWFQTDEAYVLKAEIPGIGKETLRIDVEQGKIVEISGQWQQQQQQKQSKTKDWRSGHWWEHGYVRRLELPEDAEWRETEANLNNETFLEARIPKKNLHSDSPHGHDVAAFNSDSVPTMLSLRNFGMSERLVKG